MTFGHVGWCIVLASDGKLMVAERGRMMMAEAKRAVRVDYGRDRGSRES